MIKQIQQLCIRAVHSLGYNIQIYHHRPFLRFLRNYYQGEEEEEGLIGVEVGVYKGENAKDILKYLPVKKLYLIDPYKHYTFHTFAHNRGLAANQEGMDNAKVQAIQRLDKFKDKVVWINEFSDTAWKKILEKVDFVYIDGNHSYEFVKQDIENYYNLLKRGGILAGHDINQKGVILAVAGFVKERNLLSRILSPDWIIIKNEQDD